ncbi:MAG: GGDEF domain-containing protein, partial [Polyangiaceae bacterium]|nr:GGDEF domain-containing protein [Polyangiaceae bacterium]
NRSTNGTYVNHVRIQRTALRDGDRIGIGKCMLKYLASGNLEAAYHEELQRLVNHDGLTGVKNKRWFDEELPSALDRAAADAAPFALALFDLDHFKRVNDSHGHPAGDAVLRRVAEVVQLALPHGTTLARVGGEEFAVLLPDHTLRDAFGVAGALRERVAATRIVFEKIHIPVTLSLGVAEHAEQEPAAELYARADSKLYDAKHGGRNRVAY